VAAETDDPTDDGTEEATGTAPGTVSATTDVEARLLQFDDKIHALTTVADRTDNVATKTNITTGRGQSPNATTGTAVIAGGPTTARRSGTKVGVEADETKVGEPRARARKARKDPARKVEGRTARETLLRTGAGATRAELGECRGGAL
jgi:hypothetical protein